MPTLDLEAIPTRYEQAVRTLAGWHAAGDPTMRAWVVPDDETHDARREVRLIEVSDEFPEGGAVRPDRNGVSEAVVPVFPLGPSAEFPFRSRVAQVTPHEWDELRSGRLRLTQNWDLSRAAEVDFRD